MNPASLLEMLDQLEANLVGASQALPHEPDVAGERVWDARSIAAQMRVLIERKRVTGDHPRLDVTEVDGPK